MSYDHLAQNPLAKSRPHGLPPGEFLEKFMLTDWDTARVGSHRPDPEHTAHPGAARTEKRRRALSAAFPGSRLLIPAGTESLRSADLGIDFDPPANSSG